MTMGNKERRREVAANLRILDDEAKALIEEQMFRFTIEELAGNIMFSIGLCVAMGAAGLETKTLGDSWGLLAGLIDPTCAMRYDAAHLNFICSRCGARFHDLELADAQGGCLTARYCPDCGARVMKYE